MVRKLAVVLMLLPVAARAQSAQDEGQWAGDDQYSAQQWDGADAQDGSYAQQDPQYETPPPPPDDDVDRYAAPSSPQYAPAPQPQYAPPPQPQYAPVDEYAGPSMDDFRVGLRPYGRWIYAPDFGWVWRPRHVSSAWQPYWDGHWAWTNAGWLWVTDEPWGWATYHYGRWAVIDGAGWVWVPGRVWAPAWVTWRWGGGYAGWCPLGPRGVVYVQPRRWVFVSTPNFLAPVRHHMVPIRIVTRVWTHAQPLAVMRPTPRAGPPPRIVEQHTHVPVRVVPIVEAASRAATRPLTSGAIPVWRPRTTTYRRPVETTHRFTPILPAPERARPVTPGGTVVRGEPRTVPVQPQRPVEQRPAVQRPVEQKPVVQRAVEQRPVELKPVVQRPVQQRPVEQRPVVQPPIEQRPAAERVTPVQRRPLEQRPPERTVPAEPRRPAEQQRADQQRPAVVQPARPTPAAQSPARPAQAEKKPARPPAEQHAHPVEAKRDRERD